MGFTATNNAVAVSPIVTTTYYVTNTDACGNDTDTIMVYVDVANTTQIAGDTTLCKGNSIQLTATNGSSYVWNNGIVATTATVTVVPLSTTTYVVTASNACGSSKDSITIHVLTPPHIIATGDTDICLGQSTTLSAMGASNYTWGGGVLNDSITVSPMANTSYYVSSTNSCGTATDSITVYVGTTPNITGNATVCVGNSTTLTATGALQYTWHGAGIAPTTANTLHIQPTSTTTYYVQCISACGVFTDSILVVVNPLPVIKASADTTITYGSTATVSVSGPSLAFYAWLPNATTGCNTCTYNEVTPTKNTQYIVTCTDLNGCIAKDTVEVKINADFGIYIPNAFTVDGNNLNDYFKPVVWGIKTYYLRIYDRWGLLVYEGNETQKGWDGYKGNKIAPQDLYVYVCDASPYQGVKQHRTGTITLLR